MNNNITSPILQEYYSEEEMAQILDKTVGTMKADHSRNGAVPPRTKLGKKILYNKKSFEEWLKNQEEK